MAHALKILVVGDHITDYYRMFRSTRLCPEAPVPVLVRQEELYRDGGAALVVAQLRELIGEDNILTAYGSQSIKERIFADDKMICRIDCDAISMEDRISFETRIRNFLMAVDMVVVSDYGKGAIDQGVAEIICKTARVYGIPMLVDAKAHWDWYGNAFAVFPNEREGHQVFDSRHVIRKLGEHGCSVDGRIIPPEKDHEVVDVCGAGDIFLAGFAAKVLYRSRAFGLDFPLDQLYECARFANHLAGISVEHLGTYVVKGERL